eukprot:TRINITY_DN26187_c0_g1_i1.p1 TRINITY_DN26187_c0_g1~~TRINITY_DN26187_c0_g1_i1.p1  ORF type:complete len:795 (+),score=113.41 TRINITY_DN26187_c0_g1_i1:38-2386(+)
MPARWDAPRHGKLGSGRSPLSTPLWLTDELLGIGLKDPQLVGDLPTAGPDAAVAQEEASNTADLNFPRGFLDEAITNAFARDVDSMLSSKGWCLLDMARSSFSRDKARRRALRKRFWPFQPELIPDLGAVERHGKMTSLPADVSSLNKLREKLLDEPAHELDAYDADISLLVLSLEPWTSKSMGFCATRRTESMLWQVEAKDAEAEVASDELFSKEDVEDELELLEKRCLCFLYFVDTSESEIILLPHGAEPGDPSQVSLCGSHKGKLLVFRCDRFSLECMPSSHLTLLAWALGERSNVRQLHVPAPTRLNNWAAEGLPTWKEDTKSPALKSGRIQSLAYLMGGSCHSTENYRALLSVGVDGFSKVPNSRFDSDLYLVGEEDFVPWKNSYHIHGCMCEDEYVLGFDNAMFGLSDAEADLMSPSQRKVLEVGYDCLLQAGYTRRTLEGAKITVSMGDNGSEWVHLVMTKLTTHDVRDNFDFISAKSLHTSATRLSHTLGLTGPTCLTETACSAGLTATCNAIVTTGKVVDASRAGKAAGFISGGVTMICDPGVYLANAAQHMLSTKGRCFTFNNTGDGYSRGEGCCCLYASIGEGHADFPLEIARLVGSHINQDGRSASMTAPNGPSQQMCIRASLRAAGLQPSDVTTSECHGTGTSLGDPIEVGAVQNVMAEDDDGFSRTNPLFCTSSKSNLGHMEANAGVAGLYKCILMSAYGIAPPNCHLHSLNQNLLVDGFPVLFETEMVPYTTNSGMAGVSSFGVSGTNAHAEVWGRCNRGNLDDGDG